MRIGTVCYCTRQGIGWLPKWYFDNGVVTDVVLLQHGSRKSHTEWYPPGTPLIASRPFSRHDCIWEMLRAVDALLFFETPFDWDIIRMAREMGKKTAIYSMYECTPRHRPHEPDLWLCPSLLDVDYFGGPFVPVPVNLGTWKLRTHARRFLHNGGHLGLRGHKGTLEILQAMKYVRSDITLKVTSQDVQGLDAIKLRVPEIFSDKRVTFSTEDVPHEKLYDDYDVFIMAEKYNGLSLPPAEARAAGMLVMTSDRYPLNTWLPRWPLIPVEKYQKACVSGAYLEYDEAIVKPEDIAAKIDEVHGMDITAYSQSGKQWAEENSWEVLKPRIMDALEKGLR